eukprot:NODE_75_length_3951_cov_50.046499_g63_i0.p1 GENE.NODE_75_length_3951_cov_50.046499_g63_i0~~NODE_75_length_3951_cov_50.046499_g63_i0.p1  ORF type:complete len:1293 (-),score=341.70 NODE_75_length_3951_cov_50.046499_g63_i0:72-3755(-)
MSPTKDSLRIRDLEEEDRSSKQRRAEEFCNQQQEYQDQDEEADLSRELDETEIDDDQSIDPSEATSTQDGNLPEGWCKSQDWVPDKTVSKCQHNGCNTKFGMHRRHHCRRCGSIFCSKHCAKKVSWAGSKLSVCDGCYQKAVNEVDSSQSFGSIASTNMARQSTVGPTLELLKLKDLEDELQATQTREQTLTKQLEELKLKYEKELDGIRAEIRNKPTTHEDTQSTSHYNERSLYVDTCNSETQTEQLTEDIEFENKDLENDDDDQSVAPSESETISSVRDDNLPEGWCKSQDWVPDKTVSKCQHNGCNTKFGMHRRHHCRRCGGIFCSKHCAKKVQFGGSKLTVCDGCHQNAISEVSISNIRRTQSLTPSSKDSVVLKQMEEDLQSEKRRSQEYMNQLESLKLKHEEETVEHTSRIKKLEQQLQNLPSTSLGHDLILNTNQSTQTDSYEEEDDERSIAPSEAETISSVRDDNLPEGWCKSQDWVPDKTVSKCQHNGCNTKFGMHRRHHCRRCGGIFCSKHCAKKVLWSGSKLTVCDGCHSSAQSEVTPKMSPTKDSLRIRDLEEEDRSSKQRRAEEFCNQQQEYQDQDEEADLSRELDETEIDDDQSIDPSEATSTQDGNLPEGWCKSQDWVPDKTVSKCQHNGCNTKFGMHRRHHCRRCGSIFCSKHCAKKVLWSGSKLTVCDGCYSKALSEIDSIKNNTFEQTIQIKESLILALEKELEESKKQCDSLRAQVNEVHTSEAHSPRRQRTSFYSTQESEIMSSDEEESSVAASEEPRDDNLPEGWCKSQDWVPDKTVSKCQHNGCNTKFGMHRRHHCRRCGSIFCSKHCAKKVLWSGSKLTVCDGCYQVAKVEAEARTSSSLNRDSMMFSLEKDLYEYKKRCEDLSIEIGKQKDLTEAYELLKEELETYKQKCITPQPIVDEDSVVVELKQKVIELEKELETYKLQIEELNLKIQEETLSHQNGIEEWEAIITSLNRQLDECRMERDEHCTQSKANEMRAQSLEKEIDEIKRRSHPSAESPIINESEIRLRDISDNSTKDKDEFDTILADERKRRIRAEEMCMSLEAELCKSALQVAKLKSHVESKTTNRRKSTTTTDPLPILSDTSAIVPLTESTSSDTYDLLEMMTFLNKQGITDLKQQVFLADVCGIRRLDVLCFMLAMKDTRINELLDNKTTRKLLQACEKHFGVYRIEKVMEAVRHTRVEGSGLRPRGATYSEMVSGVPFI